MMIGRRIATRIASLLAAGLLSAGAAAPAAAAGLTTHVFMTERALDHIAEEEVGRARKPTAQPQDGALTRLLEANRNTVLAGAYFPDSGYVPGTGYGEEAHWDGFIRKYTAYIRQECSAELPITRTSNVETRCARLIAHMFGTAAHGIGDETWDFSFETVTAQRDLDGRKGNALGSGDIERNLLPADAVRLIDDIGIPSSAGPLSHESFTAGCQAFRDGSGIGGSANEQCISVGEVLGYLHDQDPSANIEFNMDVTNIVRFDRYADMPLSEDLQNDALDDEVREATGAAMALYEDGLREAAAGTPNPLNLAAGPAPAAIPPYQDLAHIFRGTRGPENTDPVLVAQMAAGTMTMNMLGIVERLLSPYDGQRIREQMRWGWDNVLLASGGIIDTSSAIAGYWRGLWARLHTGSDVDPDNIHPDFKGPTVVWVHPQPGETGVPYERWVDSRCASTGLIAVLIDSAYDGRTVHEGLALFDDTGQRIAADYGGTYTGGFPRRTGAQRQMFLKPRGDLKPGHTYTVVASDALRDVTGLPLTEPYVWQFTTSTEADQCVQ